MAKADGGGHPGDRAGPPRCWATKFTCFIGADNKKIGRAAGEWIVKKLGGKGKVVELKGLMTSTPGQDRNSGFREGIAGSGIEVIFEADMKWLEPDARKEMESALSRFNKIDLRLCAQRPRRARRLPGRQGRGAREGDACSWASTRCRRKGVAYVQQGILAATFQYPTGGAEAIDTALKILKGEPVPKEITLGSRVFDKGNVAEGGQELK